jgi:hypothetical protein
MKGNRESEGKGCISKQAICCQTQIRDEILKTFEYQGFSKAQVNQIPKIKYQIKIVTSH